MDRPTFFLSSTVYDFGDLRGALKDYLELRGCRVLASEFTDFTRPLDAHSYEACLRTIEQANLFVLFIGRRIGGWYDEPNQISITRAEFRHAYRLAQEGRLRILCFVRNDVWDHRQSVRDLANHLKADPELTERQRDKLVNHPSQAMDSADAIISFIDEVTRNNETSRAAKGQGQAPIANWIWPFSTFSQVRQAIDPLVLHGLPVADAAGRKALEEQLYILLQKVVSTTHAASIDLVGSTLNLRETLGLRGQDLMSKVRLTEHNWKKLFGLSLLASRAQPDASPITAHLSSGLLLAYEPQAGVFVQTPEYDLLVRVIDQATLLQKTAKIGPAEIIQYGQPANPAGDRIVPADVLVRWLQYLLRWADLIANAKALARSLGGGELIPPPHIPATAIAEHEEALAEENITVADIRRFVMK